MIVNSPLNNSLKPDILNFDKDSIGIEEVNMRIRYKYLNKSIYLRPHDLLDTLDDKFNTSLANQDADLQVKNYDIEKTVDQIREKYGFKALVYARSKTPGGTAIERASLVGGHNGGNAYE